MDDEKQLARRAADGDQNALALLIARHRQTLFAAAYSETRRYDDAADAVCEAIVRACVRANSLRTPETFAAWLCTIVRNEARRITRRRETRRELFGETPDAVADPGDAPMTTHLRMDVERALTTLPEDYARTLSLFYRHGNTVREIADLLNRPEGTVKWMLARGRAQLLPHLKGYEPMEETKYRAVMVAPNVEPTRRNEWRNALLQGGWTDVEIIADAERTLNGGDSAFYRTGQQLVVVHEKIGDASAFELLPFLLNARSNGDFAIFILLAPGRSEASLNVAAMSAYMSGVDYLLVDTLTSDEFAGYAAKLREKFAKGTASPGEG
ncbi:MAG: RNA polymerase sigma factor [Armatimonadetes bacterium]|nr:RNA polymerase sigma factor [Armatimonadota bacterium]